MLLGVSLTEGGDGMTPVFLSARATKYHGPNYPAGAEGEIPVIYGGHFPCFVKSSVALLFQ